MLPFSRLLTAWWDRRIMLPIARARDEEVEWPSNEEQSRLLDTAAALRNRVLELGRDAGLDAFEFRAA
jgi:hypothetical protein